MMDEAVPLAALGHDEAEALGVVEPFGAALLPTSDPLPPQGTVQLPGRPPPSAHAGEGAIGHGRNRGGQRHREECKENCRSHVIRSLDLGRAIHGAKMQRVPEAL